MEGSNQRLSTLKLVHEIHVQLPTGRPTVFVAVLNLYVQRFFFVHVYIVQGVPKVLATFEHIFFVDRIGEYLHVLHILFKS